MNQWQSSRATPSGSTPSIASFDATVSHDMTEQEGVRLSFVDVGPHTELNVFEVAGNSEASRQTPMFGRAHRPPGAPGRAQECVRHDSRSTHRAWIHRWVRHELRADPEPVLPRSRRPEAEVCVANPDAKPGVQPAGHSGSRVRGRRVNRTGTQPQFFFGRLRSSARGSPVPHDDR
jgi:hypothetical protein